MKKAVTLVYPPDSPAPIITSITHGVLADTVLKIAHDHDIIVKEDSNLTEVLSMEQVGSCVPEETWLVLAGIFAFLSEKK